MPGAEKSFGDSTHITGSRLSIHMPMQVPGLSALPAHGLHKEKKKLAVRGRHLHHCISDGTPLFKLERGNQCSQFKLND